MYKCPVAVHIAAFGPTAVQVLRQWDLRQQAVVVEFTCHDDPVTGIAREPGTGALVSTDC